MDVISSAAIVEPEEPAVTLSALALARAVETGAMTPSVVFDLCLKAVAEREGDVRALSFFEPEAVAAFIAATPGLADRPLRGLPVGVKDVFDTADLPTEYGSPIWKGHRPKSDSAVVTLTRRAGGVVFAKTLTTEFAHLTPGPTRNPHNLAHTPGGSSSGSAAAVAAGIVPIAFGTQTGGSVIRPASFCGVAGYKPTYRLLPTPGLKTFSWYLDTVGLFAASVADVAFAAEALTGRPLRTDRQEARPPRLAIARPPYAQEAAPDAAQALEEAVARAERAGASVTDFAWPEALTAAHEAHGTIQDYEACRALGWELDHHRAQLSSLLAEQLEAGLAIPHEAYDMARRTVRDARRRLAEATEAYDALITFAAPGEAPAGLQSTGNSVFNRLWTLVGTPAVSVPGLTGASGLPVGIQLVGRFARDQRLLAAADFVEKALAR